MQQAGQKCPAYVGTNKPSSGSRIVSWYAFRLALSKKTLATEIVMFVRDNDHCKESVVLKLAESNLTEDSPISRISGVMDPRSVFRLINNLSLDANPRVAKVGRVTVEIEETLRDNPDRYRDLSKGLLIAAWDIEELDRNRWQVFFNNLSLEGIVDGGHNLLSIGRHLIETAVGEDALKAIKSWSELQPAIKKHAEAVEAIIGDCNFGIPVEIVFPGSSPESLDEWPLNVQLISHARNNNAELKEVAKANYQGHFDFLKDCIPSHLRDKVEWKSGEGGYIKAQDLVMLSLIPASLISEKFGVKINPPTLYSSKGQCLKWFSEIYEHAEVSELNGKTRKLTNPLFKSALVCGMEFVELYEELYLGFPDAYNKVSKGFGRISCVKQSSKKEQKFKTKYRRNPCEYKYPDGFIIPILWGLRELLEVRDGEVVWASDPNEFLANSLVEIMNVYYDMISMCDYDPQKIGKNSGCYNLVSSQVRALLTNMQIV